MHAVDEIELRVIMQIETIHPPLSVQMIGTMMPFLGVPNIHTNPLPALSVSSGTGNRKQKPGKLEIFVRTN